MAKGILEIKRQIRSVQNTRQITKAMEMVAASKLKKAQNHAETARPYADKLKEVITNIAASTNEISHPMLETREVKKTAYIVITSDSGLAGGYNANLLRMMMDQIEAKHKEDDYVIFVIGRKGRDFFKKKDIPVVGEVTGLSDSPTFADIQAIAAKAVELYASEEVDEVYLVFNEFINPVVQRPVSKKLLPLADMSSDQNNGATAAYEYEPSAEGVLAVLLPKYAETLVYSALLEAKASEFGARMNAMGNATNNATELISQLTLQYNRARQAAITQEITEIVAGANALS